MTHIKTTSGRRKFIKAQIGKAKPSEVKKIYLATERITGYYKKQRKR